METPGFILKVYEIVANVLPLSPIQPFIASLESVEWLGYLNYFIPIGTFITIGSAWLVAIGIFYIYQAVLRWTGIVGS